MKKYLIEERRYKEILNLNPFNAEAHFNLGNLLFAQEKFEESEKAYREAIRHNPKFADAHNAIGKLSEVYAEKPMVKFTTEWNSEIILPNPKKFEEAENSYKTAIAINPYYLEAHNNLGSLLFKLGRLDETKDEYEKILILHQYIDAHYSLGVIFLDEENFELAEREFTRCIELNPNFAEPYEILCTILLKTKRTKDGLRYLDKAGFLKPELKEEIEEINEEMK
ncbi:MAG: tetratricopeptide repeat protein [Candidatus Altarchaeum sp.]|nr:tetratricopeptide repeat protein [Candidatus Altarchaeum sp.]